MKYSFDFVQQEDPVYLTASDSDEDWTNNDVLPTRYTFKLSPRYVVRSFSNSSYMLTPDESISLSKNDMLEQICHFNSCLNDQFETGDTVINAEYHRNLLAELGENNTWSEGGGEPYEYQVYLTVYGDDNMVKMKLLFPDIHFVTLAEWADVCGELGEDGDWGDSDLEDGVI